MRRLTERVLILNKEYHLTPFEKSTWNLKLILRQNGHELEAAYAKYIQWIKWRRCELQLLREVISNDGNAYDMFANFQYK